MIFSSIAENQENMIFTWSVFAKMLFFMKCESSVLLGTHTLLDKPLRVLQLPTHLSSLTANGYQCNS